MFCLLRRDHITLSIFRIGLLLVAWSARVVAQNSATHDRVDASYVALHDGPGRFALATSGRAATLLVGAEDFAGVARAVGSLGKMSRA
jgi:hypothetical protein